MEDPWNTNTAPEEPAALSDRDRVTVTMKGGSGFDAPWIVLHAKDVDEANSLMENMSVKGLKANVIQQAKEFADFYGPSKASGGSSSSPSGAAGYRGTKPASQAPYGAPSATCPVHSSPLVYNEPFASGGKQISGRLACPERGCRAITIWHNKDGSWKQG